MVAEIFLIQDVPIGKTFRVATYLDSFTCEYDDFVIGKFQYKQLDGRITFKNQSDCMEVILCITFSNKHHGPGKMPYPNAEKIFGSFNIKKGLIAENGAK